MTTEIIIKKFGEDKCFTCLIFKDNHLKPTSIKLNSSHHARIVLEQFTKLCSSELEGAIPSDGVYSTKKKLDKGYTNTFTGDLR